MDLASIPSFLPIPFASSAGIGYINTVPQTASPTAGLASYPTGFVPANFAPIASGGIPPSGGDFNGVFFDITTRVRWAQAGGGYPYDSTFSAAIGGYPKGALVLRSDSAGQWLSTVDNNTTDPDSSGAAGWVAVRANTGSAAITATSGTVSPSKTQLGAQVLIVSGTLTANAQLQLPLTAGAQWTVVNNTTGSFVLTVGGATGTTATVVQGTGIIAYSDGTNYFAISAAVSGSYLPIDGTAVAATKLATARTFSITGDGTAAAVPFDGTANATLSLTLANTTVTAGSYGNSTQVGTFTVDAKGRLTTASNVSINVPGALGYTPANKAGDTFTGLVGFPSYAGAFSIAAGNADGASYSAYNTSINCWNGVAIKTYTGSITGVLDSRSGLWDMLGGYKVNGNVFVDGSRNVTCGNIIASGSVWGASVGVGNAPAAPLDVLVASNGRLLVCSRGTALSIDSVNAGNTAYAPINFNATTASFAVGPATFNSSITATGGFQSSDKRLKKNIKARAVQRGFALRIAKMFCEWDRIADGIHDVGLVAQKVKAYAARYVNVGDDKRKLLAIDKAGIALEASMDCALQLEEQAATIKALMRRIETLENAR